MRLNLTLGIQFMLKDKVRDMPTMLPQSKYHFGYEVKLPAELEPFMKKYAEAAKNDTAACYEAPKVVVQIWRPKVRKKYPEMFSTVDQDGKTVKFNVTDDNIIDSAICMNVEDVINKFIEDNKDKIVEELHVKKPECDEAHYLANTFVRLIEWEIEEAEDAEVVEEKTV